MKFTICLLAMMAVSSHAQTVYKCGGTYTDQPCKGGQELDIRPTDGMHSLSGTKRQNYDSVMRQSHTTIDQSIERGVREANRINQCHNLMLERQSIDARATKTEAMKERRFQIRKSQFELNCKPT